MVLKLWTRLVPIASSIGNYVLEAIVTTVTLSIGFMAFNDFIVPMPDLTGRWKFTVIYKDTANKRFQDLTVTYQVIWVQSGLELSGHGEKLSDRGLKQSHKDYHGDERINIEVTGRITRRYFSQDILVIQYKEAGLRRESSSLQRLVLCGKDGLGGSFMTTIANTSGPVWWQRIANRDAGMYEPVDQLEGCGSDWEVMGFSPNLLRGSPSEF